MQCSETMREEKECADLFFFFKQKTAYEIYQCDWSSDVCSSDLSDKIVLKIYKAKEAKVSQYPRLYQIVNDIAKKGKIPSPKIFIIPSTNPNAFATSRKADLALNVTVVQIIATFS